MKLRNVLIMASVFGGVASGCGVAALWLGRSALPLIEVVGMMAMGLGVLLGGMCVGSDLAMRRMARQRPWEMACPVCGQPAKWQFTSGRGKPYIACDEHKVAALLVAAQRSPHA